MNLLFFYELTFHTSCFCVALKINTLRCQTIISTINHIIIWFLNKRTFYASWRHLFMLKSWDAIALKNHIFFITGLIRNAWHHGGPTSSFIHLVSSFCFLLPRIIIEAKLVEVGFLSRGNKNRIDEGESFKFVIYFTQTTSGQQIWSGWRLTMTDSLFRASLHHHPETPCRWW